MNDIEKYVKEFREKIGNAPESAKMEEITGRETCLVCGHPFNGDRVVKDLESWLRSTLSQAISSARTAQRNEDVAAIKGLQKILDTELYGWDAYPHSDKQAAAVIEITLKSLPPQ